MKTYRALVFVTSFQSARHWLLLVLLMACAPAAMAAPPDLTAGELRTDSTDSNLGPTGMRGWIYHANGDCTESRQILVTEVEAGSPAAAILAVNDVILGADGTGAAPVNFTADARKSLGYAIADAEARAPATLQLLRWRAGVTDTVQITLQTLGAYSATAPYNCPKSAAILEQGLQYVMDNESSGMFSLGTLALLAADDPSNPNNAARQARAYAEIQAALPTAADIAQMNSDTRPTNGSPWSRGHQLILLAEYYLKTNDQVVLPAISALVNTIANGQSPFGSMGHQWATLWPDGSLNGPVGGYGAVNSAAVPCFYGLLLAKECGITHPKLEPAIARASNFFASYAGKGGIPYGEHLPGNALNGNGKSGLSALAFELQDHRTDARDYFAQMAVASAASREGGHTGYGFNVLWTPLGAAVGGEDAASSYFSRAKWNFDMARRWDGSFDYGAPNRSTSGRRTNWRGLNMSTPLLLSYALPLRNLQITGRNRAPEGCLTPALIDRAVLAEQYDPAPRSTNELLADLQSFSIGMRSAAAAELANRTAEKEQLLVTLTAQANDLNGTMRTGACETLGIIADLRSAPVLVALLTDNDNNVRYFAARALRQFPQSVLKPLVYPILAAAAANAQPTFAMPEDDPAQLANLQLIELLFSKNGILNNSIEGIDRNYLYPAIRMATNHPLGGGRKMREMYTMLTDEDINALADAVVDAIHFQAPGDTMGSAVVRNEGLKMLQARNIAEGVPLAEIMSDTDGRANVSRQAIEVLASYAGSSLLVQPDPRTIDFLREFWGSDYIWDGNLWPDALAALNAIAADTNPVAPTPFKSIQSVTTDAPTLTLPVNRTSLRVKAFDYAKGDSRFTWRKIHGAGEVSFFPNATASSKNTNVLFDSTPGQYLFEVTMSDSRGFTEVSQTVAVTLRDSSGNLPANSPPTAHAQALTIGEATPTPITLTGHDPEGYALNFKVTAQPANGTLSGTAPYLIYTSNFNYTGPDSFTFEVMDSEGQMATATVSITVGAAAPTGLAIYEPFDYPAGPLNGKSGTSEVGFSGPWTTPNDASILGDSIGYGPLPTQGGKFTASNPSGSSWGARRSISPSALAGNGLLADGATLWFSATAGSLATGNASLSVALANSPFATGGGQRYIQNEGAQLGAGIGFQFSIPSGFVAATFGNTSGSTVNASGDSAKTQYYYNGDSGMVVGKITWGATPEDFDTIEIYEPQTDLLLPARPTTVLTTKVDQSTFDTLAIYRGGTPLLDEVRFGSNYQSVLLGSVAMTADSSPPIPNPIGFHMSPAPSGTSSVRMVATSAYDPNGVEYYFTCTAGGGHDSGWQSSPEYTDTGLTPGVTYSYTVKARDLSPARNETAPSTAFSATLPTSTLVPVVLNLSQADAEAIITAMGFTVGSITTAPSSSVNEGDVTAQSPAAGTSAALGTAVDIVISETVQLATVPNVVGQTQSAAATTLAAQDLLVGTVFTDYSETVPAGQIMGTNPAAGTQVAFGSAVNLLVSAGTSSGLLPLTELLFEDFESPSSPVAYVQGSLPDNGKWVGSTVGFQPGWRGITDKAGGDFTAPDPNHQAFALRYKQSGITTAQGAIGTLTLNTRYSLSFDVMRDGIRSPGTGYICELVAFDPGSSRADASSSRPGSVLASATGNAPSDGSIATISLEFTALAANPHLGKDIGIRFVAPSTDTNALIDNVSLWAVGVPLADTVPPTLLATHPADDATGFPINEFPTLTFSEPIAAGTGAVLLRNVTDGIQQFLLTNDPSVAIITGSTLRLLPPGGLQANKDYTVLVDLGAVTDLAGNRFAGISDPTAWNFTTSATDLSPPTLSIANEQTSDTVYVGDVVTYTLAFSERIDGATIGATDFSNAGTSSISIGTIIENSPGLYSVAATPLSAGTLQLQVNAGAVITDLASNALDTTSPIADEGIITVIPPNLAPVWAGNPINKTAVNVGVSYSGTLANDASDAENDPLIFTKISGPAWLSVAANGTLSGTPTLNDDGPNSFTVGVSDGISPAVQATLNISVLPLIDPTPSSLFLYFDGGTIDIDGAGNGASAGGVGTWNTTIKNWDAGVGNPYVAWNNTNGDNAVIAGTGILTVGVPVTVGTLTATSSGGTRTISGSEITINNGINLGFLAGFSVTAPIKLGGSQTWIHNQGAANSTGKSITGGTALNYRTLTWETTNGASSNRVTHSNISGSGSIIKKGTGWLGLGGTNTFTGSTTINAGTIDAISSTALGNANNQLIVNTSGTLNMSGVSLSIGNLTGTGGVITSTSTSGTRTFTIGSGDTGGGNFQGIIQNGTTGSTTALTKTGTGTITLSGSNTYTGATIINNGTLFLSGATQGTTSITFTAGSLGLDTGFPVTAASAGVNLSNGTIKVTGAPVAASYTLLAASSITGTPVLADPIAGYALQVVGGTELHLVVAVLPNQPPVFTANPLLGADAIEGTAYTATLAGTATDDNDDTLTYAKVSGPVWLSVAEDGTLTGTPTNSDVGLNEFTVSVSDGIAAAVEATLSITVINTNDAPVWASSPVIGPDAAVSEGYLATLAGFASDVDAGAVLAFSVVDGPAWLNVATDGTLSGTPDIGGLNVFTVSVSDGIAEPVNATLHITVIGISDEQMWKTSFGDADLSDLSADYDGDGLSNGEERIWGLDPTKGSSRNPIITPLNPATGKFRYTRRDPARTGKTFTVWTSGDLANWTQDTAATQLPGPMVDFIETVEVTLTAAPVNGRLFVRVRASD